MGFCGRLGERPNTWKHFGPERPRLNTQSSRSFTRQETVTWEGWTWAMDSGTRITGGGCGYAAILAHAEGVLYGTELGSVTLLYGTELGSVTLKRVGLFCFPIKHSTHTLQESRCRSARSSGCSSIAHFLMPVRQVQSCSCNRDSSLLLVYLAPNTRARTHTRRDGF